VSLKPGQCAAEPVLGFRGDRILSRRFQTTLSVDGSAKIVRSSFGTLADGRCFVYAPPRQYFRIMLMTINTKTFLAEAAPAAAVSPCRHSFDEKRLSGDVLALAGRYAR
jgi:hypothetical protein